jgi:catalase
MFIGTVNNFDENGISYLDKKNKDVFIRFCKSMKLTYKNLTWQQVLDLEREVKRSDWDELSNTEKAKVEKLVIMMDSQ